MNIGLNSDFSRKICVDYALSKDSQKKLLVRLSPLARKQFIVSRALVSFILNSDWGACASGYMLDDSVSPPSIFPDSNLYLSLSHSGDYVAAAVSINRIGNIIIAYKGERTDAAEKTALIAAIPALLGFDETVDQIKEARALDLANRQRVWDQCVTAGLEQCTKKDKE